MYQLFKPLLFSLSPEKAHELTVKQLRWATKKPWSRKLINDSYAYTNNRLEKTVMGLRFNNPIGLAAGFDKNAELVDEMENLGFGFIEVGTVTPMPQAGNEKPRLFRLPKDEALINRMGFNNDGVQAMVARLKLSANRNIIVGGNIGKNKTTLNDDASLDYLTCFHALHEHVDYFAVNVSSPNTPNLRDLQDKEPLRQLLTALRKANLEKKNPKPILLKISPDLYNEGLQDIVDLVNDINIQGVIAANTTVFRTYLQTSKAQLNKMGVGGLSGKPLRERSTEMIRALRMQLGSEKTIIAVGGIDSPQAAKEKIEAGADLIQLYTGLVYQGPGLVKSILKSLAQ